MSYRRGHDRSVVAQVAVVVMLLAARGSGQPPPKANPQTPAGLPPGTPLQQSPAGLMIPVQPPPAPPPMLLQRYTPVTAARLKHPEDSDWLMVRRTYDGWGYSPLDQITPANVGRLQPVWVFSSNDLKPHESAPLVNNGVMFVTTPTDQVIAIDVKSGNLLWRYKRSRPAGNIVPN